jgi:hypothetical protein
MFFLRYLYSNEVENDTSDLSLDTCILIYKFAHEMQIDSLTVQLAKLLKKTKASEIFGVFDLYQTINRRDYLGHCKEVYLNPFLRIICYYQILILGSGHGHG